MSSPASVAISPMRRIRIRREAAAVFALAQRPEVTPMPLRRRKKSTLEESACRELAARTNDGIHVRLLWHPHDDAVSISVADATTGERFQQPVPRTQALFAFNHPFTYAQ
jgi:hypothetical protein